MCWSIFSEDDDTTYGYGDATYREYYMFYGSSGSLDGCQPSLAPTANA